MVTGKSVLHVNQDIGKCFSTEEVKGYYNNLTEKVTMQPQLLGRCSKNQQRRQIFSSRY